MQQLQKGSKGQEVERLQILLNLALLPKEPLVIDGDFGNATLAIFKQWSLAAFQKEKESTDKESIDALEKILVEKKTFLVILDAGHGGLDPKTGEYTTPAENGKRYQHKSAKGLHTKDGWFFEGVENRIIAEGIAENLKKRGVSVLIISHPYLDLKAGGNAAELERRGHYCAKYMEHGFNGVFYSIHSNAAPEDIKDKNGKKIRKRTKSELDAIRGLEMYTTKGETLSDHYIGAWISDWAAAFGKDCIRSFQDKEADFMVISEAEKAAKINKKGNWLIALGEFGVYTSQIDAEWICSPETRQKRIETDANFIYKIKQAFNP